MAGKAPVAELRPHMETFLEMMHNQDLDVKKAALLMVNAAVHHQVRVVVLYTLLEDLLGGLEVVPGLLHVVLCSLLEDVHTGGTEGVGGSIWGILCLLALYY